MLETLAADLLSRFLGQYIEGLETRNVSLGLWSGKLSLRSLALRTESLAVFMASLGLDLGASVRRGEIEELEISVPWKNIWSGTSVISLKGLRVEAVPTDAFASNTDEISNCQQRKRARLVADEALREAKMQALLEWRSNVKQDANCNNNTSTWYQRLLARVVSRIQLDISDIVVKYVLDEGSSLRIASYFYLRFMSVVSTDRSWKQNSGDSSDEPILYKVVTLEDLSFYAGEDMFTDIEVFKGDFSKGLASERNQKCKLFGPFSATLQAKFRNPMEDMKGDQPFPTAVLYLFVHSFVCSMDRLQYISMIKLLEAFLQKTKKPRDPREKWKWLVEKICPGLSQRIRQEQNLHAETMRCRRLCMLEYLDLREKYLLQIYEKMKQEKNIKDIVYPRRLEELEDTLELDDILLYRNILDERLNDMTVSEVSPQNAAVETKTEDKRDVGWLQWASSYFTSKREDTKEVDSSSDSLRTAEEGPSDIVPAEEEANLKANIDEFVVDKADDDSCLFRGDVVIEKAVFIVCDNEIEESKHPFAEMHLEGLSFGLEKRLSGTIRLDLLFHSFSVVDCRKDEKTMLISRKYREEESSSISSTINIVEYSLRDQLDLLLQDPFSAAEKASKGIFGALKVEVSEGEEKNIVYGRFGSMNVSIIDQSFFKTLFCLFELPKKKTDLIESVSLHAKRSLSEVRAYLESRLYERKKRFQLKVLIEGPSILLCSSTRRDGIWLNFDTLKLRDCSYSSLPSNHFFVSSSTDDISAVFGFYQLELSDLNVKYMTSVNEPDATCIVILRLEPVTLYFLTLTDAVSASNFKDLPAFIKGLEYRPLACLVGELPALEFHTVPQLFTFVEDTFKAFTDTRKNETTEHSKIVPNVETITASSSQILEEAVTDKKVESLAYFCLQLRMPQVNVSVGNQYGDVGLRAIWHQLSLCLSLLFEKQQFSCSFETFTLKQVFSKQQPQQLMICSVCENLIPDTDNPCAFSLTAQFHHLFTEDWIHVRVAPIKVIMEPTVYADIGKLGYDELFLKKRNASFSNDLNRLDEKKYYSPKRKRKVSFDFENVTCEIERNHLPFAVFSVLKLSGTIEHMDGIGFEGQGMVDNIFMYNMTTPLETARKVLTISPSDCRTQWKLGLSVSPTNLETDENFIGIPQLDIEAENSRFIFLSSFWTELKAQLTRTLKNLSPSKDTLGSMADKEHSKYAPFLLSMTSSIFELYIPRSSSSNDAAKLVAKDFHLKNKLQVAVNYNVGFWITTGSVDGMLHQMTVDSEIPSQKDPFCNPFLLNAILEFDIDTASNFDPTLLDTTEPPPDVFIRMKSVQHTMFHVSEVQYTTLCHILYGNLSEEIDKESITKLMCRRKSEDSELSSSPEQMLPGEWLLSRQTLSKEPVGYRAILEFPHFGLSVFSGGTDSHADYAIAELDLQGLSFLIDYYDDGRLSVEASAVRGAMLDRRACSLYGKTLVFPSEETQENDSKRNQPLIVMRYYGWPEAASVYSFSFSCLKFFVVADFIRTVYRLSVPFTDAHFDPWLLQADSLEESTRVFNQPYYGKQITVVFSDCQFYFPADVSRSDSHALVLGGDIVSKYDISSEESGVYRFIGKNMHVLLGLVSEPNLLKALYPFELTIDYTFGSDLQVLRVNVDSILCRLGIHDAPIVFSVIWRLFVADSEQLSIPEAKNVSDGSRIVENNYLSTTAQVSKVPMDFQCNIQGIRLVALEERTNSCVPILEARIDRLQGTFRDFLCGQVKFEVAIFLFHEKKGWWEPFLERWPCNVNFSVGSKNTFVFELLSEHRLNINSTEVAVEGILKSVDRLRHIVQHIQNSDLCCANSEYSTSKDRPSVAAFVVHNALGVPISLTFPYDSSRYVCWEGEDKEVDIRTDELIRALTAVSPQDTDVNQMELINSCTVQVPGYEVVSVSASEYGVHLIPLHCMDATVEQSSFDSDADKGTSLSNVKDAIAVWDVSMKDGCPYCTLRSRYRLVNKTSIKIEVTYGRSLEVHSILPEDAWSPPLGSEYEPIYLRPCIHTGIYFDGEAFASDRRMFSWSNALESFQEFWRKATAITREERKISRKRRLENYSDDKFMSHMNKFISLVCCVSEMEENSVSNNLDEFYLLLFPRVDQRHPFGWESGWLDLEIYPPLTVQNRLPREVAFRLKRSSSRTSRIFHSTEEDSFGVLEGILEPLQSAEIFSLSHEISENTLSLRYDNLSRPCQGKPNYKEFMKRADTPEWGQSVALQPDCRVELFSFSGSDSLLPRGLNLRSQKVFARLSFTDEEKLVGHHFKIIADYWIRNKSSSAINIRVVSNDAISFFSLAPCPPGEPVDPYVVFDGNDIAFAVAGHDSFVPLMEPLANVDKPLELDLHGGNYVLDVRPGKGSFAQSLVATIRDCIRIENCTNFYFQWCQSHAMKTGTKDNITSIMGVDEDLVHDIPPGKCVALHWDFVDKERLLSLRRTEDRYSREWQWSRPFSPEYHGDVFLKMYSPKRHEQYIPVVRIQALVGGSRKIVILEEDRRYPPYQIVNLCRTRAIAFHQVGTGQDFPPWLVRPGRTSRYAWDDPCGMECKKRLLAVEVVETISTDSSVSNRNGTETNAMRYPEFSISIDIVSRKFNKQVLPKGPALLYAVTVSGPTKVVTFVDDGLLDSDDPLVMFSKISLASSKLIPTPSTSDALSSLGEALSGQDTNNPPNQTCVCTRKEEKVERAWHFSIALNAVGISFIDSTPTELAYLTFTNVHFDYQKTADYQMYDLSIGDLQLDNQLPNALWPVIAWPSERRSSSETSDNSASSDSANVKPTFQITIEKSPKTFPGIQAFTGVYFSLQRLCISLDEYFLRRCWPFLQVLFHLDSSAQEECLQGDDEEDREEQNQILDANSIVFRERLYIEWLLFGPVQLIVSFSLAPSMTTRYGAYRRLIRVLLATVGNVEGAEFRFNALELQHVFDTESHLRSLISEYYITQVLGQRLKLISSNSLLGNPAALFDSIALGAKDFFVEPSKAVGGRDFIIRLDRGSKSLVTKTVGGLLNSINQIPRSLSVGLATAVGNREYLAERETKRTRQPTSAVDGFVQGAKYFGEGLSKGVSGVFKDPYQGLKREGASGFFKGLGKGIVGGIVHPVTGVLDFIAEPAAGLRNMTVGGLQQGALPMRPPRAIGKMKQLESYDVHAATGKAILQAVIRDDDEEHEELLYWIELDNLFQYTPGNTTNDEHSPEWQLAAIVTLFTRSGRRGKALARELLAVKIQEASLQGRVVPVTSNFRGRAALLTSRRFMITAFDGKILWQRKLRHVVDAKIAKSTRGTPALAICVLSNKTEQGYLWERIDCPSLNAVENLCKVILRNIRFVRAASYTSHNAASQNSSSVYKGSGSDGEGSISEKRSELDDSFLDSEREESRDMLGDIFDQVFFLDETTPPESSADSSRQEPMSSNSDRPVDAFSSSSYPQLETPYKKSIEDVVQKEIDRCVSLPSVRNQSCKRSLRLVIANALEGPIYLIDANLVSGIWCQEPTSTIPSRSARICEVECSKGFMKGIEGILVFAFHDGSAETPYWLTVQFLHTFLTSSKLNVKAPSGIKFRVLEGTSEHSTCIVTFARDNLGTKKGSSNSVVIPEEERTGSNTKSNATHKNDAMVSDEAVVQLANMGFDPENAYKALKLTSNNVSDAVQMLLEWNDS